MRWSRRPWANVVQLVAASIRYSRARKGWNQEDLARAAGVGRAVVARFENGQNATLPLRELSAIAFALGVRVADLLPPALPFSR